MAELDVDSETPDHNNGVGVAESDVAAPAPGHPLAESVDPEASLIKRLWRAELDIGAVEKAQVATVQNASGGTAYTYRYSGHDVIVAAIRPALARHGVKVIVNTEAHERIGNITVIGVEMFFINVDDTADRIIVKMVNYGGDKGDKGASKALTNCVREGLKKTLGITSEEDARADETTTYEPVEGATRAQMDEAKDETRDAIEKWAKAYKAALESAATLRDVMRLEKDNKDQLASETLPEVTRTFFIELAEARKAELR